MRQSAISTPLACLIGHAPCVQMAQGATVKFPRRQFLHLAAAAAAMPLVSRTANAQSYPTRPVHWIVPSAAGGSPDIVVRLVAERLSERFGQPLVVENRPGGGGNLGAEAVARAAPDGYTLLFATSTNMINVTLYEKLNFNLMRDIEPVAGITRVPFVMEVNPSFSARTIPEFIAYARANPGKINFASAGNGTVQHVCGELFKMMTGIDMVHVPYRGAAAALTGLMGGEVQVMFDALTPASLEYIRTGRVHAMAVTTAKRSEALPDTATVGDFVPGYEASASGGMGVPKNTPVEIIDRLNREINAALADPKTGARLADLGGTVLPGSPADFARLIADDSAKWGKVVKFASIKAD
jgi:tripartite-type tricarboxylate transporter receptor subunit TctC